MSSRQLQAAGSAARRLLAFAWEQSRRDTWLVTWALRLVCRTFQSDPQSSAVLLRQALRHEHMVHHAFEEMHWIAHELSPVILLNPEFVEDVYKAAFAHTETSDSPTSVSGSRIFDLTSNRRQDFQGALYELTQIYPGFLRQAPSHATRALISALESYTATEHPPMGDDTTEHTFNFEGRRAAIRPDYSSIWGSGMHVAHDARTLLNEFENYLRELSQKSDEAGTRHQVLCVVVGHNRLAAIWRLLLVVGTAFPQTLGAEIRCLAWAKPILTSFDTTEAAGNFVRAVFRSLPEAERERVEREILSIPTSARPKRRRNAYTEMSRLLGCLSPEFVVTEETKRHLATMASHGGPPPNDPLVQLGPVSVTPYSETNYLADLGVPVEAECNRLIEELSGPVRQFASNHSITPTAEEATTMLAPLQELREKLMTAESDGVHAEQANHGWGHLAEACERITRIETLSCDDGIGALTRDILLEAANHPIPLPNPKSDRQFDEHPSWGGPSARISAAAGLAIMARRPECVNESLLNAIERLSVDPVPAVRLQIANHLGCLYYTAPEVMWRILEQMCREEGSRGVLTGLVGRSLVSLAGPHPQRVTELAKQVFARVITGPGAKSVREACVHIFTSLYLWQNNATCKEIVIQIAENPQQFAEESYQLLVPLRETMSLGLMDPPASDKHGVRKRAIDLLLHVLESIRARFSQVENTLREASPTNIPDALKEEAKDLCRLADSACYELYFASGAFAGKSTDGSLCAEFLVATPENDRFFRETKAVLTILADLGFPAIVHRLLETLEFLLKANPKEVFLFIGDVVRSGTKRGYQHERMAADLIVRLVERYLAEYRQILREDRECRDVLREILDTFVQWPNARRLTCRLDEIFR